MESKDKLSEIDLKYHMYYYFNVIIKIEGFDLDKILSGEKTYEIF